MLNYEKLARDSALAGFTHCKPLRTETLTLKPEVRAMCEANSCGLYGASWCCPPACGDLEECQAKFAGFQEGILVQTVGTLEDELDGEGMMETEAEHKEHFMQLYRELRKEYTDVLALGSGGCRQCKECSYPDAPCRFPEYQISSMEAYGLLVLEVCRENDMPYYYGKNTIAYTSCFLLK